LNIHKDERFHVFLSSPPLGMVTFI
jgi:hypothetical protein